MLSRVTGIQKNKAYLYKGLSILPKTEFYAWIGVNKDYIKLFEAYIASGRDRRLAPSVNRKDSKLGYSIDNMEVITHSKNSSLSSLTKKANHDKIKA